ncbi:SDR family NAD(P)-dependent oxidoreductase, partial [Nocardia sp. NPDC055321]
MRHGVLPATLHVDAPSPHVDWASGAVELLTEAQAWPETSSPRRAAVSGFGISGTNAHVILEQAPVDPEPTASGDRTDLDEAIAPMLRVGATGADSVVPWVLSAKSPQALRGQAERLREFVTADQGLSLADVASSLVTTRSVFEHRAVVLGAQRDHLLAGLNVLADSGDDPDVIVGQVRSRRVAFVFPGQGSQWVGMARELLESSPVFASTIRQCESVLAPHVDWSLTEVLSGQDHDTDVDRVDVIQPVLFAVMVSLAALWRACGVVPDAVVGHSQGEIAAAYIAGALSLDDAAKIVALRSKALRTASGTGGMVAVPLSADATRDLIDSSGCVVSVAAINGPGSVVVAGVNDAIAAFVQYAVDLGVEAKRLPVDYPSHSPLMETLHAQLVRDLSGIRGIRSELPWCSTLTGDWGSSEMLDAEYWYRNLRQPVEFESAITRMIGTGYDLFVEVSPHPVLTVGIADLAEAPDAPKFASQAQVATVGTLRRDDGGMTRFVRSLAQTFAYGVSVDWASLVGRGGAGKVQLPTYAFHRDRYWLTHSTDTFDARAVGLEPTGHPLITTMVPLPGDGGTVYTGRLSLDNFPWLKDHAVTGSVLLPGTAFLDMALEVGVLVGYDLVEELTLEAPLLLGDGSRDIHVSLSDFDEERHSRSITVFSRPADSDQRDWTCHAVGRVSSTGEDIPPAVDLGAWPPAGAREIDLDHLYAAVEERGFEYGPAFQGLRKAWKRGEEYFGEIDGVEEIASETGVFAVHPALLDPALHLILTTDDASERTGIQLPFSWTRVALHRAGAADLRVRLARTSDSEFAIDVADGSGVPVASIGSLVMRRLRTDQLDPAGADPGSGLLFHVDWQPVSPEAVANEAPLTDWAVLGSGRAAVVESIGGGARARAFADIETLVADSERLCPPVVVIVSDSRCFADPLGAQAEAAEVLNTIQKLLDARGLIGSQILVVTNSTMEIGVQDARHSDPLDLAGGAIWGLVRTAQSEHPGRFVLVDVDEDIASLRALPHVLPADEPQVAIRHGEIFVPRLKSGVSTTRGLTIPDTSSWRLDIVGRGTIDNLSLVESGGGDRPLAAGEVRVAVRAAGLNFRDVLISLGMYPGTAELGSEGAGVVLEVGAGVETIAPGDEVMGLFCAGFGPMAITDHRMIVPKPPTWTFIEAAAVPLVFATAYYGLVDLAELGSGDKVLVHSAAGGVGMAAVQLAKHWGAEVFGTASPGKWSVLRSLGLDDAHIGSSRSLDFESEFGAVAGENGIDVVLNSLAKEFVDASLRMLAGRGRFIEMGKTDIRDAGSLDRFGESVDYRFFDLFEVDPGRIGAILRDVTALFDRGVLELPPITVVDVRRAPAAFRLLGQGRHSGKLVLTIPEPTWGTRGTVLITGGTGTLGGHVARHLASRHGVDNFVLTSRSGTEAAGTAELVADLAELGARAAVVACDITDRESLRQVLTTIPADRPLRGVVHAAGVLDDRTIESLTPEAFDRVFRPKVAGAMNLHELTCEADLSLFVMFSSVVGVLGSAGQANYAAANATLDSIARYRQRRGLAATSLAWGVWEQDSSMTGHLNTVDRERITRSGIGRLSTDEGLAELDSAVRSGLSNLVPFRVDREALSVLRSQATTPTLLRALAEAPKRRKNPTGSRRSELAWSERLSGAAAEDRLAIALETVCAEISVVLGHAGIGTVDRTRSFNELGFDSLTAVELRNRLSITTGMRLPATAIFDHPNPAALSERLVADTLSTQGAAGSSQLIDKLNALLGVVSDDASVRETVRTRVRTLLADWEEIDSAELDLEAAARIQLASADEIFAIIDDELERS